MQTIHTVKEMQAHAEAARCAGKKLALVPTMGALHQGHLALAEHAGKIADHVTVSIFVNPTQFGPNEDFGSYPRTIKEDLEKLESLGCVDTVFIPEVEAMYPRSGFVGEHWGNGQKTWVRIEELDKHLCGAYRDGHFLGVTTVVTKLFNACNPHFGVFGLKDAQQFLILRRMVEDLNMGIEMVGVPTVRETDGLASSSRNVYLTEIQRRQAPSLQQGLQLGKAAIEAGEFDPRVVREIVASHIKDHSDGEIQYIEIVDTDAIQPVLNIDAHPEILIALAVFFGKTRLIDNVFVTVQA